VIDRVQELRAVRAEGLHELLGECEPSLRHRAS
jgi:hypothetical protein